MSSAGMVVVRRRGSGEASSMMAWVFSLWEARTHLDGLIICRDGRVPFSRLILAAHSPHLRELFISRDEEEHVQKILLADFSVCVVRGLIQLLHGGKTSLNKYQFPDLKELMDHLDVKLFSHCSAELMLQQSSESRTTDAVITKLFPGTNKRLHHTSKPFTDWSKNICSSSLSLDVKEEETLEERIFTKVTYTKPLTVHAQNLSENLNDGNCKKRKQSFAVDLSKSKRTCVEPSSGCKRVDEAKGEKTLTLGNISLEDIVVQNVESSPPREHDGQLPITFIINDHTGDNQTQTNVPDGSIYIQAYTPAPLVQAKKRDRSSTHPPGEVKTEEEAKLLAAPFIGKVGKPPQYKCQFDNCSYSNTRLLMAQSHVYKHLEIYTFQCHLCGLKCRLETNFEKHLNTHGVTRRKEKAGKFMLMEEEETKEKTAVSGVEKIENCGEMFVLREGDTNEDDTRPFVSVTQASVIGNYQDEGEARETRTEKCYTSIGEPEPQYHLNKKALFIEKEKAEPIIQSYARRSDDSTETRKCQCSLCSFESDSESEVLEHIALKHLNIFQFKCDLCSMKFKIRRQLLEHLSIKHGTVGQCELEPDQEKLREENSLMDDQDTLSESEITDELNFPFSEHNMTVRTGAGGVRRVYVGDAKFPLLRLNRSVFHKLSVGKLTTKEEADNLVSGYTIRNTQTRAYECSLCDGAVKREKLHMMQRHLYEHFNLYFYTCSLCHDIFRFRHQYKEHQENHQKIVDSSPEFSENKQVAMIGKYHEVEDFHFIPETEARDIVSSYFYFDENKTVFVCKLCSNAQTSRIKTFNHCLKEHLKIFQYQCDECQEYFQLESEIGKHYLETHGKKFEKNSKLDKLQKSEYYESFETDFGDSLLDLSTLEMAELKGKKISTKQAKSIKGRHMMFNEQSRMYECELCNFKREWKGNLQHHVLTQHYDVYLYRCPVEDCGILLRNWPAFQSHQKSHKSPANAAKDTSSNVSKTDSCDYMGLTEPLYVGETEGLRIARSYQRQERCPDTGGTVTTCTVCGLRGKSMHQMTSHVLAKHLVHVCLYKCQVCAKLFRHSRVRWREHEESHTRGGAPCPQCPGEPDKVYSKESLKAHIRRNHTAGEFRCGLADCARVFGTKAEARQHERTVHRMGLPVKSFSHVCEFCDYSFPTRSRWKKHVVTCQRGTSRTGFRKQISDVLEWLGRGGYRCTFCSLEFHPEADSAIGTALPEARSHVANVHGMRHMRKAKMQWHGDPKNVEKNEIYKDKSNFWNQKAKDIDKIQSDALQENKMFTIETEVNENIAEAARSHEAGDKSLTYQPGSSGDSSYQIMGLVQPGSEQIIEDGQVEQQVLVSVGGDQGQVIIVQNEDTGEPGLLTNYQIVQPDQETAILVTNIKDDLVKTEQVVEIENVKFIEMD